MKRFFAAVCILALLAGLLGGCGYGAPSAEEGSE